MNTGSHHDCYEVRGLAPNDNNISAIFASPDWGRRRARGRRYVLKFMSCGSRAGDNQILSLGDCIEAALMLAYDECKVG